MVTDAQRLYDAIDLRLHENIGDLIEAAGEHFARGQAAIAARLLREAADKICPESTEPHLSATPATPTEGQTNER